ncbi:MAG TPA: aminotransferase class V-fold PLP-dependent enzyme, partial [Nitrolancea sp.]|nr:aminotransferase class V-fold PLP-dependent enzyme [Nitrolancea sp.]
SGGHLTQPAAQEGYQRARESLAALIGAAPENLALTRNATDGVDLIAAGLKLDPSAVALTTDQEHPAVILPWSAAERRGGARLELFAIGPDPEVTLANFKRALKPETKMVIVSQVSCETGQRLPVEEICRICRERGILTMVDAAQSLAQFPIDVARIGCDCMTGNGHKWLAGPKGTGFLYVSPQLLPQVEPIHVGDGSVAPRFDRVALGDHPAEGDWTFEPSASRFEYGTRNWHTFNALPDSIAYLSNLGWSDIEAHCAALSTELKERLRAEPGVTLHSPLDWEDSSALVTFGFDGWNGVELSQRLWNDYQIIQRRVQVPNGVRISCAYFNDSSDLDRLFEALRALRRG